MTGSPGTRSTSEALGTAPVTVNYTVPTSATEGPLGAPVVCTPGSGTQFPVGTTVVTCNGSYFFFLPCAPADPICIPPGTLMLLPTSGSFNVTITAGAGPTFSGIPADQTLMAAPGHGTVVLNYALPSATDPSGVDASSLACSPGPGSAIPVGVTVVTCTVKDTVGNQSTASFKATVLRPEPVAFRSGKGTVFGNYAYVPLSCPATSAVDCAGTLTLTTSSTAARTIKAGTAKFRIAKGKSAKVKVKLTKPARKILARNKKLRVKAKATTGSLQSTRSLTLKLAKRK